MILLSLLLHLLLSERPLVLPVIALLLWPARPRLAWTEPRAWAAAILGLLLSVLYNVVHPIPSGLFPPAMLAGAGGVCLGLAALAILAERQVWAWSMGFVLAGLSGQAPEVAWKTAVWWLWAAGLVGWAGRRVGARAIPAGAAVLAAGLGIGLAISAAQGVVAGAVLSLLRGEDFLSGLGSVPVVSLTATGSASASGRLVMEVEGEPVPGLLRTAVMDRFDGQRWSSSARIMESAGAAAAPEGAREELEILLYQSLRMGVPAPAGVWARGGAAAERTRAGLLVGGGSYGQEIALGWTDQAERDAPGPEALRVPEDLAAALRGITAGVLGDMAGAPEQPGRARWTAERLERWFHAEFRYALTADLRDTRQAQPGGAQPERHMLVVMLEERRPAWCVYFASAMAAMMRAEGVPARLVGGFSAGALDGRTGRVAVRESDAHAWVEVWIEGRWEAFDPTPAQEAEETGWWAARSEAARRWLETWMARLVLRLKTDPQRLIAEVLGSWPVLGLAGLGAAWLARGRLGWLGWRGRAAAARAAGGAAAEVEAEYLRYLELLRGAGVEIDPAEAEEDRLARLAESRGPAAAAAAAEFLGVWRRWRYGEQRGEEGMRERISGALRGLEARLGPGRAPGPEKEKLR